jgi:hypothetical protein
MILRPLNVQKKARPIPSLPIARISNSPYPKEHVMVGNLTNMLLFVKLCLLVGYRTNFQCDNFYGQKSEKVMALLSNYILPYI